MRIFFWESKYSKCLLPAGATLSGNMGGRLSPVQGASKISLQKKLVFLCLCVQACCMSNFDY